MTKIELAMLAGAYAIRNSKFGKNGGGFVKGVFSPNPEEIRFSEAAEILCETVDNQNVFTCPVKPGQTVYMASVADVAANEIEEVRFSKAGWYAIFYEYDDSYIVVDDANWMRLVFPTREAAERRMAEMRGDDGQ